MNISGLGNSSMDVLSSLFASRNTTSASSTTASVTSSDSPDFTGEMTVSQIRN